MVLEYSTNKYVFFLCFFFLQQTHTGSTGRYRYNKNYYYSYIAILLLLLLRGAISLFSGSAALYLVVEEGFRHGNAEQSPPRPTKNIVCLYVCMYVCMYVCLSKFITSLVVRVPFANCETRCVCS